MKSGKVNCFVMAVALASLSLLWSCGGGNQTDDKAKQEAKNAVETDKAGIEWVSIPGGTYIMGSLPAEPNRKPDEVQHQVTLNPFKMSKYEVTVGQFKKFVDATGYVTYAESGNDGFKGSTIWNGTAFEKKAGINWRHDVQGNLVPEKNYDHPVTNISWDDAIAFAKWLGCRLPTESEWEYAARGGTATPFHTGNCLSSDQANYNATFPGGNCSKGQYRANLVKVGSFPANPFGLFDMHGNVSEWCYDAYGEYPTAPQTNPFGPTQGSNKVMRGGSWRDNGATCRSAARTSVFHGRSLGFAGFRVVKPK